MIFQRINLKDFYPLKYDSQLEIMVPEISDYPRPDFPLMLILPGGGYAFVSKREQDPIALAYMLNGFAAATLVYKVKEPNDKELLYPEPYLDVMASLDYLRKHAKEFRLNVDQFSLVGFSAGGHLAASYGYMHKNKELLNKLNVLENNVKPNGIILGYPVITFKKKTHGGSMINLTNEDEELIKLLSVEDHIDNSYPPTFAWNTTDDGCVPVENGRILNEVLEKFDIPHRFIEYPHGRHGLSLNTLLTCDPNNPQEIEECLDICGWVNESVNFIKKYINK